jgi:hypothetical protein
MRLFIASILLILLPTVAAPKRLADDLYIYVSLLKSEKSRDSNSRQTRITVNGEKIVYERVYRGYRQNKREPVHKEFTIKEEDVRRLENLIRDGNLLASDSLKYPDRGVGFVYFEISMDARLGGKQSHVEISGPSKAAGIKDKKLYKNTKALLEEIFRILNAQDEEISYEADLVNETP